MKTQLLFFVIGIFNIILTDGRLIQKNKTRNIEEAQTEKPNPSIRLTRDIDNDSLTGFSREESIQSEEFIKSYNRRARHFFKAKPKAAIIQALKKKRITRDSTEIVKSAPKSSKPKQEAEPNKTKSAKPNEVLVKKPIPKFNDIDYEDFQSKMSNSQLITDSGDHEDEDFNLGDYDFDVNHDEFNSGRKPLEPRISTKNFEDESDTKTPDMKITSKVLVPVAQKTVSNKKERAAELKSSYKTKEVDYYDDTTTTKAPEKDTKAHDDDYSDENEESKEFDNKNSSTRAVRSWNINLFADKFNEKTPRIVTKYLSVLPLFPLIPRSYPDEISDTNHMMSDPLTGRQFMF